MYFFKKKFFLCYNHIYIFFTFKYFSDFLPFNIIQQSKHNTIDIYQTSVYNLIIFINNFIFMSIQTLSLIKEVNEILDQFEKDIPVDNDSMLISSFRDDYMSALDNSYDVIDNLTA